MHYVIELDGIPVEVTHKNVRNLNLRVRPPDGQVRVSAPLRMPEETVRNAVASRLAWIRRQRRRLTERQREPARELATGETHYFCGSPCTLRVIEQPGKAAARLAGDGVLELRVKPGADEGMRRATLEGWFRRHLRTEVPGLVRRWETILGVQVDEWRIRRMKTRWGSCNIPARRIWLNLALAARHRECLEYVLVHEMVHLLERRHNARFYGFMDRFMPDWRSRRELLNEAPP